MTLGSTQGVHPAVAAMANGYELNVRPSRVSILDSDAHWTVVRLDNVVGRSPPDMGRDAEPANARALSPVSARILIN